MTGGSFCSIETKSTAEMKFSRSSVGAEDETISLPENIRALLDGSRKSSLQNPLLLQNQGKVNINTSLSSLDEIVRRDTLSSVSVAVKEWDEAEKRLSEVKAARTAVSRSPGKMVLREKVASARALVAVAADESECVSKPQPHDDGCYSPEKAPSKTNVEPVEELSDVLRKYQYPRKSSRSSLAATKEQAKSTSNLFLRMSRQMNYGNGRRGSLPNPHRRNRLKLHVYDLIPAETVMQLPWGCMLPIGRCFDVVNSSLHSMGTGAYHVGIEVNGVEYSFGACDIPGHTGVFSCVPKRSPGYQYRTTIDFGERSLVKKTWVKAGEVEGEGVGEKDTTVPAYQSAERHVDGREVIKQMATEYMGIDYDLLRKNCVTFSSDASVRLGVKEEEIPAWFRNLCESGAITQDVALQTVEPIQSMFSACEDYGNFAGKTIEDGFEIITKSDGQGLGKVLCVIDADESNQFVQCTDCTSLGARRALSWTY